MADAFVITAPQIHHDGGIVHIGQVQMGLNDLAHQLNTAVNSIASGGTPIVTTVGGDLSGTLPNPTVVKASAGFAVTGDMTATGDVKASGRTITLNAASATPILTSSVQQFVTGNVSTVAYVNALNSSGGKIAYSQFDNNYTLTVAGFATDNLGTLVPAIQVQGTGNTGITHILSSSGSGGWFHTGTFSSSAAINASGGFQVKEGSNLKQGAVTLVGGTLVVANTSVTANSRIFLTSQADGGTPGFLRVSARTAGTSFTILSSSGTDTSLVAYEIFEPGT